MASCLPEGWPSGWCCHNGQNSLTCSLASMAPCSPFTSRKASPTRLLRSTASSFSAVSCSPGGTVVDRSSLRSVVEADCAAQQSACHRSQHHAASDMLAHGHQALRCVTHLPGAHVDDAALQGLDPGVQGLVLALEVVQLPIHVLIP